MVPRPTKINELAVKLHFIEFEETAMVQFCFQSELTINMAGDFFWPIVNLKLYLGNILIISLI